MSQLSIRNSLLTQSVATIVTGLGIPLAYENKDFNPQGLDAWCQFRFVPAVSDSLGKGVLSSDNEIGFIQISVYVKLNAADFDNQQLTIIDQIKKDFYNGGIIDDVVLSEVTVNNGATIDAWFMRAVTINYSSYQKRG